MSSSTPASGTFSFRLFIAGDTPNSVEAHANITALCRTHLAACHAIEVVDVFQEPARAKAEGILMTPTLIKLSPGPTRVIAGTLRHTPTVLAALGISEEPAATPGTNGDDAAVEIAALIETLHATDRRLDSLLAGEVDSVTSGAGEPMMLRRAQGHRRVSDNARQAAILAALPANVALLDEHGVIISVNASWSQFARDNALGDEGEAVGRNYLEVCDEASGKDSAEAAQVCQGIRSVLAGRATGYSIEYPCHSPQVQRWFLLQVTPLAQGWLNGAVVMHIDVTDRKRVEAELREKETEFRTLAESVPQIVWITRADGRNLYFNQHWVDYSGMSLEESRGYGWNASIHADDRAGAWAAWQYATATNTPYAYEGRLRNAHGDYLWWLIRGTPQLNTAGEVIKWFGTCTDINDLKLAEQERLRINRELRQQKAELRLLFDLVPAMIWFKDTQDRIVRINQRAAQASGRSVEQIEGKLAFEIYPQEAAGFRVDDLEVLRSGVSKLGIVESLRNVHGQEIWVQTDKVPYRDENGNVIGIVVMAHDVSERKQAQDALRHINIDLESRVRARTAELNLARDDADEANRAKSTFLATMSHEIRTPMTGLFGLLELLSLSELDEQQRSTLAVARESGRTLQQLIDDILDFSKIEADCLELNLVPGSVRAVAESACRLHRQIASTKDITLSLELAPDISPLLMIDPLRLGQILNNFLNNAIKFTDHGSITLGVETAGSTTESQSLRFVVRDSGVGIAAEQLSRLFLPFMQAEKDTSSRYGGTGLGLAISLRLAQLMGGSIALQSEPGQGTTATLSLDLAVCADASAAPTSAATPGEALRALMNGRRLTPSVDDAQSDGTLLLVVDDHPVNLMVLIRQLASLGYAAIGAADGAEALNAWQEGRFAAIITDCNMPRLNGYKLAMTIRAIEKRDGRSAIPIIACTANALASTPAFCAEAGMNACLVKPVDLAHISATLDRWVPIPIDAGGVPNPVKRPPDPPQFVAPQAKGLVDLVLLAEMSGGSVQTQAEIIADFLRANEADTVALRQCVALDDFELVIQLAHRVKGASLMIGSTLLAAACEQLEVAGASRDSGAVSLAMEALEPELLRLTNYFDTLMQTQLRQPAMHAPA